MDFYPKEIPLKDGRSALLRAAEKEDARDMLELLRITSGETPFLLRYADEICYPLEKEELLLEKRKASEKDFLMLAVVDGIPVGSCGLTSVGNLRRVRHRAGVAISVRKDYWGLGIGKAMLSYLLELAKEIGYEQVELEVVEGNDRAKALYEKLGFQEEGRHTHALKYDDGSYGDEISMIRFL